MGTIHIVGGNKLEGSIYIQGSKNAALPILAATLLTRGVCVLKNCPHIADVYEMLEILKDLGSIVWEENDRLCIAAPEKLRTHIDKKHVESMRSSIVLLGVLLGENGYVSMEYPGGCVIGERPIDMHINGLEKLGCRFDSSNQKLEAKVQRFIGAEIVLPFPSVGATENIILAAVKAKGITKIYGAAKEPEIVYLCEFLNSCGGNIKGAGTDCIWIEGVLDLHACEYEIPADRIVAGTYIMSALAAKGSILIKNAPIKDMKEVLCTLGRMGAFLRYRDDGLIVSYDGILRAMSLETAVYPGFPTDLQSTMLVLLSVAEGKGSIRENLYENRFRIVSELKKMNADVSVYGNLAVTQGPCNLKGARVQAKELRGNAALIMAALLAEGKSTVEDCRYVKRGYEDICRDLKSLGAIIYEKEE